MLLLFFVLTNLVQIGSDDIFDHHRHLISFVGQPREFIDPIHKRMTGPHLLYPSVASVLAVGDTSLVRTYHGDLFVWGRHLSEDICYPLKTEMFPHPRDVLAYGDEIDSGGSVTLGRM